MKLTATKPSVGRILHVYSDLWSGPRPGMVVNGPWDEPHQPVPGPGEQVMTFNGPHVNVNCFADGANDREWLAQLRASPSGNTLPSVPVFDLPEGIPLVTSEMLEKYGQLQLNIGARVLAVWPPRA